MQMHIRHETRYRYERPVKYSVQSLHLTPRRDSSQRALSLDHHGARPAARAGRRLRQHLAPAHHRAAAPRDPDRGARRGRDRGHRRRARTTARSRRSPISRPTALTAPNDEIRAFAHGALEAGDGAARARAGAWPRRCATRCATSPAPATCRTAPPRRLQERRRGVPGSCPRVHRLGPRRGHAGALRERLSLHGRHQRCREPRLGGCLAGRRTSAGRAST